MKLISTFVLALAVMFFQGCSTNKVRVKDVKIVFPSYPDEPKIAYVDTYRGTTNKESDVSAFDLFLGEAKPENKITSAIIKPYGVGMNNGKLYVADTGSSSVFVIDMKTKKVKFIGNDHAGRLSSPVSIAFDKNGMVYVSDSRQQTVQGYTADGKFKFVIGGRLEFVKPTGIAIDKALNNLYVVDTKAHKFKAYDLETKKLLFEVGKRGKGDGEFNYPTNIAVDDRNGNIVIVDTQNFRVQTFDKDGKFLRKFGKIGDRPGMFARPKGVGIDSEGHIYVADAAFNNIQVFDEQGQLLLYFGGAGYSYAQFRLIAGIYIDKNDKIAVADGFSGRVQTFQYISEKWKIQNPKKYKKLKEFEPEI